MVRPYLSCIYILFFHGFSGGVFFLLPTATMELQTVAGFRLEGHLGQPRARIIKPFPEDVFQKAAVSLGDTEGSPLLYKQYLGNGHVFSTPWKQPQGGIK